MKKGQSTMDDINKVHLTRRHWGKDLPHLLQHLRNAGHNLKAGDSISFKTVIAAYRKLARRTELRQQACDEALRLLNEGKPVPAKTVRRMNNSR